MEDNFKVNLNEYLPLRDVVFNNIRDAIVTGVLKPGERLMEKQLSEKIGVSRTPIREALRKLELEGFVEMTPRKGAIVAVISKKDIEDVLEIRKSLEGLAARLACQNMTESEIEKLKEARDEFTMAAGQMDIDQMAQKDSAFHEVLFSAAHNMKLVQIINNLSEQINRYRLEYLKDKNCRLEIIREHQELTEAIAGRDSEASYASAVRHIENQKKAVIESLL